jgi:hypothetical protein
MQGKNDGTPLTEVARSFSYKLNVGNYESRDFFCSQKSECTFEDADTVAKALHAFCKKQVMDAVREYQSENPAARR